MNNIGMNVEVNPNEDTEWNDILRAHGVIPEKGPDPDEELEKAMEEAVDKAYANRLEGKSLKELDELEEDGLEDEDFVEQYRQQRIAQLREMAAKEKHGEVVRISKPDYSKEITEASKDGFVLVHLSYPGIAQSKLLDGLFMRVAPKFKDVKFVDIDARQVNEKYPAHNCPTILVYKDTNVVKQYITLTGIGGNAMNIKDLESILVSVGAVARTDSRLVDNKDRNSDSENDSDYDSDD